MADQPCQEQAGRPVNSCAPGPPAVPTEATALFPRALARFPKIWPSPCGPVGVSSGGLGVLPEWGPPQMLRDRSPCLFPQWSPHMPGTPLTTAFSIAHAPAAHLLRAWTVAGAAPPGASGWRPVCWPCGRCTRRPEGRRKGHDLGTKVIDKAEGTSTAWRPETAESARLRQLLGCDVGTGLPRTHSAGAGSFPAVWIVKGEGDPGQKGGQTPPAPPVTLSVRSHRRRWLLAQPLPRRGGLHSSHEGSWSPPRPRPWGHVGAKQTQTPTATPACVLRGAKGGDTS